MTQGATIDRYMSRNLVTLSPDTEVTRAVATLIEYDISAAPVVDDLGRLVGILTARDCFRAVLHAHYHQELGDTVAGYMTADVTTLDTGMGVVAAAQAFMDSNHRRYPVMQDGRLVGIITRMDLLRAFQAEG
ncbi:CBS domain-containing protein [Nioella sediminis]|jgi:CBS domain-containing protein|uniref:CBS domain-containing protein n=1 Tax=Nioella sediminis TaxID=1912092 RepID=UPI0008FD1E78|nr:CBS domain-containing protein [Nioella sediminis]TBX24615.1 transcriptional regulator [Roseovarius sp. JS7-11]